MYSVVYIDFGKKYGDETHSAKFRTKKIKDFGQLNLFNYSVSEHDLGRVMYEHWYGHHGEKHGRYMMIVKEGDEETAKGLLSEAALKTLQERIDEDTLIANLIREKMPKQEAEKLSYSLVQKSLDEIFEHIDSLWSEFAAKCDDAQDVGTSVFRKIEAWIEVNGEKEALRAKFLELIEAFPHKNEKEKEEAIKWADRYFRIHLY